MKKLLVFTFILFLFTQGNFAQDENVTEKETPATEVTKPEEKTLDDKIDGVFKKATGWFVDAVFYYKEVGQKIDPKTGEKIKDSGSKIFFVVVWLMLATVFCTVYFGFINFRGLKHTFRILRESEKHADAPGEVTHFQALCTALSGTVGLGNIAGVGVAIAIGGPGATLWMILAGFLGMSAKFLECSLAVKYRKINDDGSISGGPMYYLTEGLALKNMPAFGKGLAMCFAFCCVLGSFGGGNMFQVNQAYQAVSGVFGGAEGPLADKGWLFGLIIAVLVGFVIIGGIKRIAQVTGKLVPFMAVFYVISCAVIILANFSRIGEVVGIIFNSAFDPGSIKGGIIGVMIAGFQRATFSNEAGIGSAAIAHAAVKTNEPLTEGFVAMIGPFVDTVIICSMTALVIVFSGTYTDPSLEGVGLTTKAFADVFDWFPNLLSLAILLFAFSTMISWSYYGNKAWNYMFGESKTGSLIYKLIFCGFIVVGSATNLGSVIAFSDASIFAMGLFNVIGLYILAPVIKKDLKEYLDKYK
jgi:AGCS family alanine or glycine:cation symporter